MTSSQITLNYIIWETIVRTGRNGCLQVVVSSRALAIVVNVDKTYMTVW